MSRALLPNFINLLKEKMHTIILEPFMTSYSNRWFTMLKKYEALRFIRDMQPSYKVTIINKGSKLIVDKVDEAFTWHVIYYIREFYFDYDQFQLASESMDLTTMKTQLGLMRMCTLPQDVIYFITHFYIRDHWLSFACKCSITWNSWAIIPKNV